MWENLILWSVKNFNHLPWRRHRSLYGTLVSEIMLQQTTVSTVEKIYPKFMESFPSLEKLAHAQEEQVLINWKGLGYYRRARNLHFAAQEIIKTHNGQFPRVKSVLMEIKGIGDYTSSALLAIGLNDNRFAVDVNLQRVLSRLYAIKEFKGPLLIKSISKLEGDENIQKIFKQFGARLLNEALMDLGRMVCRPKKPFCDICPLSKGCMAFQRGEVDKYPKENTLTSQNIKKNLVILRLILPKKDQVLVYKKDQNEWLTNQWELPSFIVESEDPELEQYPHLRNHLKGDLKLEGLSTYKTAITKYSILNYVKVIRNNNFKIFQIPGREYKFCNPLDLKSNLSTASLKAIKFFNHT